MIGHKAFNLLSFTIIIALIPRRESRNSFPDFTDNDFQNECMTYHNTLRQFHKSPPLKINNKLIEYAKRRLKKITTQGGLSYGHRGLSTSYGENIYRSKGSPKKMACKSALKLWYSEIKYFTFGSSKFNSKAGHFSQLIWANSKNIGCARAAKEVQKNTYEIYIDCIYKKPGNIIGDIKKYVKPASRSGAMNIFKSNSKESREDEDLDKTMDQMNEVFERTSYVHESSQDDK